MSMIDKNFPLVDLHRHLDGSIRLETILEIGLEKNLGLPADTLEGLRPYVQITEKKPGVMAFLEKFEWMTKILTDTDVVHRVAYENVEDALKEGLDYVELRFSPWFMAEANHLDPAAVTEAVIAGTEAGQIDFGVRTNLIGIISRTYGQVVGQQELDALLQFKDSITALDLAGDEANYPPELFVEHFRLARDAGWKLTVHAGESAGPQSIWQAVDLLGAERIGHGVRAIEDPALMAHLKEKEIGIEVNLTSNLQTSTVPDLASHPAKQFLEYGLLVSLNTDDPGISGIDIAYEYDVAAPAAGLSEEQIHRAQRNGLATAFLSIEEKQALIVKKLKNI